MSVDLKALESLKSFYWRWLRKYAIPRAADAPGAVAESPAREGGNAALVAGGMAWGVAVAVGVLATIEMNETIRLRADLATAKALEPVVPRVTDVPASPSEVKSFAAALSQIYTGLDIKSAGSIIHISANSTASYVDWREAVDQVQSGGSGWRLTVEKMCAGRECAEKTGGNQLDVVLRIRKISIDEPEQTQGG